MVWRGRTGAKKDMGNAQIGLFDLADKRLQWLTARQGVLAANVANADTPNWSARDVPPFAQVLSGSVAAAAGAMVQTSPMHLSGIVTGGDGEKLLRGEKAPDGNQVSLDEQMEKIAQTDTDHEAVTALYLKYVGMYRTALGR
jgi:flagellar basal-body rod protein FlgB